MEAVTEQTEQTEAQAQAQAQQDAGPDASQLVLLALTQGKLV
jgi:hypothetical protein